MHDHHMNLGVLHDGVVDNEAVLETLVLIKVVETLLLHASAVEDVGAGDDLGRKHGRLGEQDSAISKVVADVIRHGKSGRSNQLHADVVMLEELGQRVNSAAVLQVTHKGDGEVIDGSELLADREKVEEGLGGVLKRSITCNALGAFNKKSGITYHR